MTRHTIISREVAQLGGLSKFYTGKPCRKGHDAMRYTAGGQCIVCCENRRRGTHNARPAFPGVHPDDVPAVREFIAALNFARSFA